MISILSFVQFTFEGFCFILKKIDIIVEYFFSRIKIKVNFGLIQLIKLDSGPCLLQFPLE
jgi:hypothetical protein